MRAVGAAIRRVFADVPYPGDTGIATRGPNVPFEHDPEAQQIEAFFAGKTWPEVTLQTLRECYVGDPAACLTFMTPAAFRYYLPSYMLIALERFDEADVIPDRVVRMLTPLDGLPGPKPDYEDPFLVRVADISEEERRAVARFLLAMQEVYGTGMALSDSPAIPLHLFWGDYLSRAERALVGPFPYEDVERARTQAAELGRPRGVDGSA